MSVTAVRTILEEIVKKDVMEYSNESGPFGVLAQRALNELKSPMIVDLETFEVSGPGEHRTTDVLKNDAVWARCYRDCKTLSEIADEFGCSIYDLSPKLLVPIFRAHIDATENQYEKRLKDVEAVKLERDQAVERAYETGKRDGEGDLKNRVEQHEKRVTELLEANNREVERRRDEEGKNALWQTIVERLTIVVERTVNVLEQKTAEMNRLGSLVGDMLEPKGRG